MKTFLLVAALAIPVPSQTIAVQTFGLPPDCTYPIAFGSTAGIVTMCHDPADLAVVVVSLSAAPSPIQLATGLLIPDLTTVVFVAPMSIYPQTVGPHHWRWTIDLDASWAPVSFVAQAVFLRTTDMVLRTISEAYDFSWM